MTTLLLATRKGLFVIRSAASGWQISAPHFAGEPVTQVLVDARDGAWYAALRLGHFGVKMRKSVDQGSNWQEIASPAFPAKPTEGEWADDSTPWSVDLIWELTAGGAGEPGTLWAGCLPAGLFKSTDGGASWVLNEPLWLTPKRRAWFGGGYDQAGIHSILVDPRDHRHLTIAISCGGVWQTHDSGANWQLTATGMTADYLPPGSVDDPNTQDAHRLVQCAAQPDALWVQHHCGIYRSQDAAHSWQSIAAAQPSGFGFAVACDPKNPQRAWFVPAIADHSRFPVGGKMVVSRTDDGGQSFAVFGSGLPQQHAYHLVYRHCLDVDREGRRLAVGSTTGGLWFSNDAGEQWHEVSNHLPPIAALRFA